MATALVTGASSGIGAAFAARLAADGYDIVAVARGEPALQEKARSLRREHGVGVEVLPADMSTATGRGEVARRLSEPSPREGPVEFLVSCAGAATAPDFADTDPAALRTVLDTNIIAVHELMRAALPGMLARGRGALINVSSINGFLTMPGGAAPYGASKAYITALTKGVALTTPGTGVRVMVLCPGRTDTGFAARQGTRHTPVPAWMRATPEWVVDQALADLKRGRFVSLPGVTTKLVAALGPHIPLGLTSVAVRRVRARKASAAGT